MNASLLLLFCSVCLVGVKAANWDIVSRKEWGARSPTETPQPLKQLPPKFVVIHHAATPSCYNKTRCERLVRGIQNYHMDTQKWEDIGYNFLVGEDGNIYEGRGWGITGAHARPYNQRSIGICILGTFTNKLPNAKALHAVQSLMTYGLVTNNITPDYQLIGHRQASATECPGSKLYKEIQGWPHWTVHPDDDIDVRR